MLRMRLAVLAAPLLLAGCGGPFAQSTAIDWSGKLAPGTITVSDPKEYRREALINERSKETAWLDQLLEDSKTIEFKPEIAREVEQITAISGALGLSFDPAAGLTYRRSKETNDLQQQIDVTKLQLQLDQLKRDAELVRAKFAAQEEPVNTDASKATGTTAAATSATTAAAADQLKAAIDKLTAAVVSRLDADGKPATLANTNVNPGDVFRDRSAYRDLLKSARNAASLDELHDADGAALLRLNFHATILPDRKDASVPGVIQAKILQQDIAPEDQRRVYAGWLDYLNNEQNIDSDGSNYYPDLQRSALADFFDVVQLRYATPIPNAGAPSPNAGKPMKKAAATQRSPVVCGGLVFDLSSAIPPSCSALAFAVPRINGGSAQEGASSSLQKYLDFSNSGTGAKDPERQNYIDATRILASRSRDLITGCGLPHPALPTTANPHEIDKLYLQLELSRIRVIAGNQLLAINDRARRILALKGIAVGPDPQIPKVMEQMRRAEALLAALENYAYSGCTNEQRRAYRDSAGQFFIPSAFADMLARGGQVSIYDVGPRDLVQQVSTVARAANSLALAVSIAGSAPGSGVAADAAGSYSRQAMGRAAVLERVPAVVGYSVWSKQTFGWVIGPRATVDPEGRVELDQSLREYDLTVDLSVPSWWPSFDVETTTAWAPASHHIADATLSPQTTPVLKSDRARVRRTLNTADYAALTAQLANQGVAVPRRAVIAGIDLKNQTVDACRGKVLFVKGDNLWRASVALLNGTRLGATAISVTPDMGGVLLDVPAINDVLGDIADPKVKVTLLTPYGESSTNVDYVRQPTAGCKSAEKKAVDGASIVSVTPASFRAPAALDFQVTGDKLDQVTRVTLNGQEGKMAVAKGGKTLKVSFINEQTQNLPVSRTIPLTFFKGDEKVAEKMVEVTENGGDK